MAGIPQSAWLSAHARARMQQRGISAATLEALLDFGRSRPAGRGREIVFLGKKARRPGPGPDFEKRSVPAISDLTPDFAERLGKSYAILESDGTVITVGHRYRRLPRER